MEHVDVSSGEIEAFYAQVAQNVKRLRKQKQRTQLDLALTIGHKSVSTIAKIEAGLEGKHYNLEHLYKIAKALDVTLCELVTCQSE